MASAYLTPLQNEPTAKVHGLFLTAVVKGLAGPTSSPWSAKHNSTRSVTQRLFEPQGRHLGFFSTFSCLIDGNLLPQWFGHSWILETGASRRRPHHAYADDGIYSCCWLRVGMCDLEGKLALGLSFDMLSASACVPFVRCFDDRWTGGAQGREQKETRWKRGKHNEAEGQMGREVVTWRRRSLDDSQPNPKPLDWK